MSYSAAELINEAYYLSGMVARDLETPTGSQLKDGLSLLNSLLSLKSITGRFIPYYQTYTFNTVIGQEIYFVPKLIEVDALTFNINTVRYPTTDLRRKRYFGTGRANNIKSLPVTRHLERTKGGTNVYLYFLPNTVYPIDLIGKFGLDEVAYDDDLSETYDRFYIDYLGYQLARRVCALNTLSLPPETTAILDEYTQELRDMMPMDLSIQKISTLNRGSMFNYAYANLGRGFTPP
jgi:hypothetical protein